jgi:MFS family permease
VGAVVLISLTAFEALAVATVMPSVAADLGGLTSYALAFGAPLATGVVGMAVAGAWADATSGSRPLLTGLGLFCAGLLIAGSAPLMDLFVIGRAVQGLGAGMLTVSIYVLVGAVVPEPARPRIFAWFAAAWVLPAMVGPAISGLMLHTVGWRGVFLLVPALSVPAGLVALVAVRGSASPARGVPAPADQVRRRVLLAVGAGSGAAVLQVGGTRHQPAWIAATALAVVVLAGCAVRLLPAGTFRIRRGLPAVIAVRGLIGAAFVASEAFLPLMLVRERHWAPVAAGAVLTISAITWSLTAWLQGRVTGVAARYRLARLGSVLLAAGVASLLAAAVPAVPTGLVVAGWPLSGAGMGLVYSSMSLLALQLSPPERHGQASSALSTGESLASAVALAVAGAAFAAFLPAGLAASAPAGPTPYLAGVSVPVVASLIAVVGSWRLEEVAAPRSR